VNTNFKTRTATAAPLDRLTGKTAPTARVTRALAGTGGRQVGVASFSSSI